ncbi:MAG: hypothetical protein JXB30_13690 [Anaerolineae bacterium]|nr:hypothetical protein [Anaerolineae bacterium]
MGRQPGSLIVGLGLVVIGGWIIAIRFGVRLAGIRYMWPAIIAVSGLACLVQYIFEKRKHGGLLFLGVSGLLIGGFLNLFSLRVGGLTWPDVARFWPVIPLCLGFALLILYLAEGMRQQSLLIPTYIFGGIGLFALPLTLRMVQGPVFDRIVKFWWVLVVLALLAIIVQPRIPQEEDELIEEIDS